MVSLLLLLAVVEGVGVVEVGCGTRCCCCCCCDDGGSASELALTSRALGTATDAIFVLSLSALPPPKGSLLVVVLTLLTDGCLDGFAVAGGVLLLPRGGPPDDSVAMVAI